MIKRLVFDYNLLLLISHITTKFGEEIAEMIFILLFIMDMILHILLYGQVYFLYITLLY